MELLIDTSRKKISFKGTVAELIKRQRMMREEVLVKVNGRLVPDTRELRTNDKVEIIKVVFGG